MSGPSSNNTWKKATFFHKFFKNLVYDEESGCGSIDCEETQLKIKMHFNCSTESQREAYLENSRKLENSGYLLAMYGSVDNDYFTEYYEYTLKDLIKESLKLDPEGAGMLWWRTLETRSADITGSSRMGLYLQNIICNVIKGIQILIEMKMYSELNTQTVVFLGGDKSKNQQLAIDVKKRKHQPVPKLMNIWNNVGENEQTEETKGQKKEEVTTVYDERLMWKKLASLVEEVFKEAGKQPHPEITAFCYLLKNMGKGRIASTITDHPALRSPDSIPYIAEEIQDCMKDESPSYANDPKYVYMFDDWMEKVKDYRYFVNTMTYWREEHRDKPQYTSDTTSFIYFVRNCVLHTATYNNKHHWKVHVSDIEREIDRRYPKFFSYLFEKQVMRKGGDCIPPDKTEDELVKGKQSGKLHQGGQS